MKKYFIIIILLGSSFYLGQWWAQGRVALQKITIQDTLSEIENVDIPSLNAATTNEEKLEKINDIYEKMMKIFLGDLALHIDLRKWQKINITLASITRTSAPTVIDETTEKIKEEVAKDSTQSSPGVIETAVNNSAIVEPNSTPTELKKIPNPTEFLQLSKIVTSRQNRLMQNLIGTFEGVANISVPKKKRWTINLDTNLQHNGKEWSGQTNYEMADEQGHVFSSSRGNGSINNLRTHPGFPKSIIIETSPDIFFQLDWSQQKQKFYGNVYELNNTNHQWQWIGSIPFLVAK